MLQVPEKGDGSQEPLAPRRGPGRDEWETHKDVIEMLYCERELPLKDVARIMQQDYGFRGTYVYPGIWAACHYDEIQKH